MTDQIDTLNETTPTILSRIYNQLLDHLNRICGVERMLTQFNINISAMDTNIRLAHEAIGSKIGELEKRLNEAEKLVSNRASRSNGIPPQH